MQIEYIVTTKSNSSYHVSRTTRWFRHDIWLITVHDKPKVVVGLRKNGKFIPIHKVKSKKKFVGREIEFYKEKPSKELTKEFWLSSLCPCTSKVKSIE